MTKIAKVVFSLGVNKEFDYLIPTGLNILQGMRVLVDFNGIKRIAVVTDIGNIATNSKELKSIIKVLDISPVLDLASIKIAKRLEKIYSYFFGEFIFMMLPQHLKLTKKTEIEELPDKKTPKVAFANIFVKQTNFLQRYRIWKPIVEEKVKQGSVLICFPQINHINEILPQIKGDFTKNITVIHSGLSSVEIFLNWKNSRTNTILLGTRLAMFYHPWDLKLIVVEEENNSCYFQEEKPYYQLTDVAMEVAKVRRAQVVLSADFPTVSSYAKIKENKLILKSEDGDKDKYIKVMDSYVYSKNKNISLLFQELIRKNLSENKKIAILWNKKGYANLISCLACGNTLTCVRCSAFLQLIMPGNIGLCPYCGKTRDVPKICDKCKKGYLKNSGLGIAQIEIILKRTFPNAKINAWDEKTPMTQITLASAKLANLSLTGACFDVGFVLDADMFLSRFDYDSAINYFIYIKKLAALFKDNIYVFTRNKNHYLFDNINNDWHVFYDKELALRKELGLPPYRIVTKIVMRGFDENLLFNKAQQLYNKLKAKELDVYGPLKEYPFKLRDKFRYSLTIKNKNRKHFYQALASEINSFRSGNIKIAVITR